MRIAVDTSVIIAVIADEPEKARLIELTKGSTIVAPPSIKWEIGNAFSAMMKKARIGLEQAVEAIENDIPLISLDQDLINIAKQEGVQIIEV